MLCNAGKMVPFAGWSMPIQVWQVCLAKFPNERTSMCPVFVLPRMLQLIEDVYAVQGQHHGCDKALQRECLNF